MLDKKDLSIGGIIGGILGAAAASQVGDTGEKPLKKAARTGLFAGLGYLGGMFVEKKIRENRR
jgi:gas vesicle protein